MEINNIFIREKIYELRLTVSQICYQKHIKQYPDYFRSYTERQKVHYFKDVDYHLIYLAEAISTNQPQFFAEYLKWCKTFFDSIGISDKHILINLELISETLIEQLPSEMKEIVDFYIKSGIDEYKFFSPAIPSFIKKEDQLFQEATKYLEFLLKGERKKALDLVLDIYNNKKNLKEIYLNIFQNVQFEVGRLWQLNKINIAQEHFVTAATQLIMSQLYPFLFSEERKDKSIIVTCVNGELHELGARMVADFFEMEGWNSHYLGANTPISSIIQTIESSKSQIIAISATMTFHVNNVKELITEIRSHEVSKNIKILVGGYPFNMAKNLWKEIDADGSAPNAEGAINVANQIISDILE